MDFKYVFKEALKWCFWTYFLVAQPILGKKIYKNYGKAPLIVRPILRQLNSKLQLLKYNDTYV